MLIAKMSPAGGGAALAVGVGCIVISYMEKYFRIICRL